MELTCPKCHGVMRTYERNGVHVDQCRDCRGIFLDRGELERLVDAENSWHAPGPASAPPASQPPQQPASHQPAPQQPASQQPAGQQPGGTSSLGAVVGEVLQQARQRQGQQQHGQYGGSYGKPRKKKSFLDELFG